MTVLLVSGGLLCLGLALALWWYRAPLTPTSLARRAPVPAMMSLRKATVLGAAGLILLLCLGTVYLVRAHWPRLKRQTAPGETLSQRSSAPTVAFLDSFPKEYPMVVTPKPAEAVLPPKGVPVPPQTAQTQTLAPPAHGDTAHQQALQRIEAQNTAILASLREMTQALRTMAAQPPTQVVVPPTPEHTAQQRTARLEDEERARKKKGWSVSQPTSIQTTREEPAPRKDQPVQAQAQTLIPDAVWVQPDHPELVLYRDQFIPGILQDAANSDIPGQLRIKVTRDVLGRTLMGVVLIPQLSTVLCVVAGEARYGQTRFDVNCEQIITPDGTVIAFPQTKLGNTDGSTGVPAHVNNHWGKLVAAAGINMVLNIGLHSETGTPSGFYANPLQQASRDATQQLGSDVKGIVERQLKVPPP